MLKILDLYTRIRDYLLVGAAAIAIVSSTGWYITSVKLDNERTAREADHDRYKRQQAEYTAEAEANARKKEQEYAEQARKADESYGSLLSKYNDSLVRYKASQGTIRRDNLPVSTNTSEGSNGPSESSGLPSELIIITYDDALICAENTARIKTVHDWYSTVE